LVSVNNARVSEIISPIFLLTKDFVMDFSRTIVSLLLFKTVLSSGYILILLSIENILASLIETCQGCSRMRNVK